MVLLQIDGVLDYSIVRAEGDALVIGVEQPSGVTFLTVLDDHIARTAAGVGVGTTVGELRKAMGEELGAPGLAMDPHMLGFQRLANARFVLDEEQKAVIAVVLRRDPGRKPAGTSAPDAPATEADQVSSCTNQLLEHKGELLEIARLGPDIEPRGLVPGCFSGNPEVAVVAADRLVVIGGEPGKLRRVASQMLPGMVYAAAVDTDADGRHEIALVTETVDESELVVRLELVRVEAGKLARVALQDLYRITAAGAGWVGAKLDQIDLLIELRAGPESIRIGGLYVQRDGDRTSMVAPLLPTTMTVRRKRGATLPAVPGADASIEEQSDGGSDPEIPPVPAPSRR